MDRAVSGAKVANEEVENEIVVVHPTYLYAIEHNPVTGNVSIAGNSSKSAVFYNIKGRSVLKLTQNFQMSDISGLPLGAYLLKIELLKVFMIKDNKQ